MALERECLPEVVGKFFQEEEELVARPFRTSFCFFAFEIFAYE